MTRRTRLLFHEAGEPLKVARSEAAEALAKRGLHAGREANAAAAASAAAAAAAAAAAD